MDLITEYILLKEQDIKLTSIIGRDEGLLYLLTKKPFKKVENAQLHVLFRYKEKFYSNNDRGFKLKGSNVWIGNDHMPEANWFDNDLEDVFPNMEDDVRVNFVKLMREKKPIVNARTFSDERFDHGDGFYTIFAYGKLKKLDFNKYGNVIDIEFSRYYYKPLMHFRTIQAQDIDDYNMKLIFK